jgi:mitochondrial fission protein ELM1
MREINDQNLKCWIITEGIAGTENQCIGVADALGAKPDIKRINLREPWKAYSPWLGLEQWWTFDPVLLPPWPDLLIASGRKSIAAARYIKRKSEGFTFTLQIQDPRIPADNFDLVAVPEHDLLRGDNVIVTKAAPNRIRPEILKREALKFPDLKKLKSPRVAVLIGGTSKTHQFTNEIALDLIGKLQNLEASLMVTLSRRTPPEIAALFQSKLQSPNIYVWDGQGENPYFAFLGLADAIIVTNDSASMLSEAATAGKPVYMAELEGKSDKFARLYQNLEKAGALKVFKGRIEGYDYVPLRDADLVAERVREAFMMHRRAIGAG